MFARRISPSHLNAFAASAALLLVASISAAPTYAATSGQLPCEKSTAPTLHVAVNQLVTEVVSHGVTSLESANINSQVSESLLAPQAEAAIRDAFNESDTSTRRSSAPMLIRATLTPPALSEDEKSEIVEESKNKKEPETTINARLPGISDSDFSRYKKQMYRRDI